MDFPLELLRQKQLGPLHHDRNPRCETGRGKPPARSRLVQAYLAACQMALVDQGIDPRPARVSDDRGTRDYDPASGFPFNLEMGGYRRTRAKERPGVIQTKQEALPLALGIHLRRFKDACRLDELLFIS